MLFFHWFFFHHQVNLEAERNALSETKILLMEEILHQLRLVVHPIIYRVLFIPGGCLGFLPPTAAPQYRWLEGYTFLLERLPGRGHLLYTKLRAGSIQWHNRISARCESVILCATHVGTNKHLCQLRVKNSSKLFGAEIYSQIF